MNLSTYECSHITWINQLSSNQTSIFLPQVTFDRKFVTCDIWPIIKWGFPCGINNPSLIEIYQSMWKVQPNVNLFPFSQKIASDYSGKSDPNVWYTISLPFVMDFNGEMSKCEAINCASFENLYFFPQRMRIYRFRVYCFCPETIWSSIQCACDSEESAKFAGV